MDAVAVKTRGSRLLLVAPLQTPGLFQLRHKEIPSLTRSPQFVSRGSHNAQFTVPGAPKELTTGHFTDEESGLDFEIESSFLYEHFGMEILVAFARLRNSAVGLMDRSQVTALERATTHLMRKICRESLPGDREVRWVNRTLVVGPYEEISKVWLQTDSPTEPVVSDKNVRFIFGWGNNVLQMGASEYPLELLKDAAVISQFLWSYLNDIETKSLIILQDSMDVKPSRRSSMTSDVIDLHLELAMMSVFHERLGTEGGPRTSNLVQAILSSWGFDLVASRVNSRLDRLEHILSARSEVLRRRTSTVMEIIVFTITVTTIISLVLTVVQTAFGGAVESMPTGVIMDATRSVDLDVLIIASLLACVLLLLAVMWRNRSIGAGGNPDAEKGKEFERDSE